MKNYKGLLTAALTAEIAFALIWIVNEAYYYVPWYLSDAEAYMLIAVLIALGNLIASFVVEAIVKYFDKRKSEKVKVNWLTVDED